MREGQKYDHSTGEPLDMSPIMDDAAEMLEAATTYKQGFGAGVQKANSQWEQVARTQPQSFTPCWTNPTAKLHAMLDEPGSLEKLRQVLADARVPMTDSLMKSKH